MKQTPEKKEKASENSKHRHHHHHSDNHHKHGHHKHKHHHHHGQKDITESADGLLKNPLVALNGKQEYKIIPQQKGLTLKISGKKRIVNNCGVQVNLRRRTEHKGIQVRLSPDNGTGTLQSSIDTSGNISIPHSKSVSKVSRGTQTSKKTNKHVSSVKSETKCHMDTPKITKCLSSQDFLHKNNPDNLDSSHSLLVNSNFKQYMHLEKYCNGGAIVMHVYQDEISHLSKEEKKEFVKDYFDFVYSENPEGVANCVMGIVHNSVNNMPDFIDYFSENFPNMTVKSGILGKSDIETVSMSKYREQMLKSYQKGTYRSGPLLQVSLVGTVHEEVGDYFPEFLDMLEENEFLKAVMPWGDRSVIHQQLPRHMSNDGPILWARPGEQMVPTADMPKSPFKRKRFVCFWSNT